MTTRPFNQQFHCANCKTWQTAETLFGRWIRNHPDLDSSLGYSVSDQDYWIHKFKVFNEREFQLLMLVEIKTMGALLSLAQSDTLRMVNQLMRNRRQTPTKELRWQAGSSPLKVHSAVVNREVNLRAYGMHVLTFSGLGPDDSETIAWDRQRISEAQLTSLLRFDLDPDSLSPLDLRMHHSDSNRTQDIFDNGEAACRQRARGKTTIPANFGISENVERWAAGKGYGNLAEHLESFIDKCLAKGYTNVDWDRAFMGAIRNDWAGIGKQVNGQSAKARVLDVLTGRSTGVIDVVATERKLVR